MAFNMKDDFNSDAEKKEIEQFGVWVKKAPEDVVETPSSETIQDSPVSSESDASLNQNDAEDTSSFLNDLPEPDFTVDSDFNANENIIDTNESTTADSDSFESLNDTETMQAEQISDTSAETDTAPVSDTSDETEDSETSSPAAFQAQPAEKESPSFQDFQEEDSAENWEPLDDAPNFTYPSVNNITVPPLVEPSETEIENSLQETEAADQSEEEHFDGIDLTEDSSFNEIEAGKWDDSSSEIEDDFSDSAEAERESEKSYSELNLTDDSFDLPDFGLTPETENFNNSENADPIELTEDLIDQPDFGSTPDTECFSTDKSLDDNQIDMNDNTEDDFIPPLAEENVDSSINNESDDGPLSEISSDISNEMDFNMPSDLSDDVNDTEMSVSEEIPEINNADDTFNFSDDSKDDSNINDDFDSVFEDESAPVASESENSEVITDSIDIPDISTSENDSPLDSTDSLDIGSPDNFDIPADITLPSADSDDVTESSGFAAPEAKDSNETEELSIDDFLTDGGEIDVSNEFGLGSDDSSDVTDDFLNDLNAEFGASSETKSDLLDEEPVDIDLEFDDKFAAEIQTDASENIEDDSNFDEFFGDSDDIASSSVEDNFDDMFAAIQDESSDEKSPAAQTVSTTDFDEVTEFDDFLSSDSGPDIEVEKSHSNKVNKQIDYDITVSQDDVNKTKETAVEVSDDYETSESIPLYGTEIDEEGNKTAFIPQSTEADIPQKAALEKSEDDDFYENLLADAENMDDSPSGTDVSRDNLPPSSSSSSSDEEEIVPIINSTEELAMKENQNMNIADEAFDLPETDNSENIDSSTILEENTSIESESDSTDIPQLDADTESEIYSSIPETSDTEDIIDVPEISLDSPSFADDNDIDVSISDENFNQDDVPSLNDDTVLPDDEIARAESPEISDDTSIVSENAGDSMPSSDFDISSLEEDAEEEIAEDSLDSAALIADDDISPEISDDTSLIAENAEDSMPSSDFDIPSLEEDAEEEIAEDSLDSAALIADDDISPEISDDTSLIAENAEDSKPSSDFDIPSLEEDAEEEIVEDSLDSSSLEAENNSDNENDNDSETEDSNEDNIVISSLQEGDEDFVDAAALADSLAETDSIVSEDFHDSLEKAEEVKEEDDFLPSFDDISPAVENSDNNIPSFDDITSDESDNNFVSSDLNLMNNIDEDPDVSQDSDSEEEISDKSLYNSILSEAFADDPEDNENEIDKNLLDIADNSEYTEQKEDERNMDFDENKLSSDIPEQSTTGVTEQTSNISEAVLKEISNELSMLRSEISLLKQELSNVRKESFASHDSVQDDALVEDSIGTEEPVLDDSEENTESTIVVPSESSTGFFDGDVEDETIALSGDELSNILNTADFTEEYVDNTSEDTAQNEISDDIPTAPETMDFDETLEEPGDLEVQDIEGNSEIEEINVPKVDDIIVDSDDSFVDNIEPETEDSISNDTLKYLEEEPKAEEIYDTPSDISENSSETESLNIETVEDSEQDAPVEETEEVVLEEEAGPFSSPDETPTEAVFEGDQWNDNPAETPEEETVAATEEKTVESEDNSEDSIESMRKKAEQFAGEDQKDLKEEIKSVLLYMDQLLENLPDEKIEEFAQSSYFETYKKLFKELGIS